MFLDSRSHPNKYRTSDEKPKISKYEWELEKETDPFLFHKYLSVQANIKFHQSPYTLAPFHNSSGYKKVDSSISQACLQKPSPRTRQKHEFFLNKCLQTKTRPTSTQFIL